jgi:putative N6-adenine-specific DNA methylase
MMRVNTLACIVASPFDPAARARPASGDSRSAYRSPLAAQPCACVNPRPHQFFAICPRGLEPLLADELRALGAQSLEAEGGGIGFAGEMKTAYAANLSSRIASRVLWQVAVGEYRDENDLYERARAVAWERHLDARQTLRVDLSASRSPLRSLDFATLRIKDAIVDRLRDATGARPSIDRARPDVRVFAYLDGQRLLLYLDLSGEPLFKRGWRADKGEAPLKENLAAGLLLLAGWTPEVPLLDPFCGSGTIAIEAALIASRRAPGLARRFAFERLAGFDDGAWRDLKARAAAAVDDSAAALIAGADISTQVVETARGNARLAGLQTWLDDGRLSFAAGDARLAQPIAPRGVIVTNPPYGEQSAPKSATVPALMRNFGDRMKESFAGWTAWMLSSDRDLPRQMRLQETRKTVLYNGPLECRLFRFEMVAGQYRTRPQPGS